MSGIEDDNWDDFRDLTIGLAPSLTPASTDSGSGEFNSFAYVGNAVTGGSRRSVFVVGDVVESRCYGYVGSDAGARKFCLKACLEGSKSCGIMKHETSKFQPNANEAYIQFNAREAMTSPVLALDPFSVEQRKILSARKFTLPEWERFVEECEASDLPEWLIAKTTAKMKPHHEERSHPDLLIDTSPESRSPTPKLMSPLYSETLVGIFKVPPMISVLKEALSDDEETEDPLAQDKAISLLRAHALDVESKWASTFNDVESSYMVLVEDIKKLQDAALAMHASMGGSISGVQAKLEGYSKHHQEALAKLANVSALSEATRYDTDAAQTSIAELKRDLQDIFARLGGAEDRLIAFQKRFENIRPELAKFREIHAQVERSSSLDALSIDQRFTSLMLKVERLDKQIGTMADDPWNMTDTPSLRATRDMEEFMRDTSAKIKQLEQRVVGDGVGLGNTVFQSFDELKTWVTSDLPRYRYGLFVDAGGLLDMFAFIGYTDFEKTTASLSNVQKTGFATMHEARLTASMQNVLPSVFGKPTAKGLDSSQSLPGISDPDKWDDGTTGLTHQIARAMIDVEFQLESTIDTVFDSYPSARQLAKDCLYHAKRFVTDFCNFVTSELKAWIQRGHSKREAWKIICVCVRRIFEELHSARVVARDIRDASDPAFTAAKIIWAVLKAHSIMAQYVKHRFKEHPSIAAVIACHLAANFHKTDDNLASKYALLETKLKSVTARLDRLEAKQETPTGKKGKHGPKGKDGDAVP